MPTRVLTETGSFETQALDTQVIHSFETALPKLLLRVRSWSLCYALDCTQDGKNIQQCAIKAQVEQLTCQDVSEMGRRFEFDAARQAPFKDSMLFAIS